jgi:hydroxymethylglutaryl-CoA lyase
MQVESLLDLLIPRYGTNIVLHIHDTRGMGLSNILIGLQKGISRYETSVGGLGGCPFAPGAAGNVATEDLVNMCHEMQVNTGIDLGKLVDTARMVGTLVDAPLSGHMVRTSCVK